MAFDIYAANHDLDTLEECRRLDARTYYGNEYFGLPCRKYRPPSGKLGLLIDSETNQYLSLYPIMDFNQSFYSYDTLDGARCQTVLPGQMTQREAAIKAVQKDRTWSGAGD